MRIGNGLASPWFSKAPSGVVPGSSENDLLTGGPGFDVMVGQGGDDSLFGAGGTDILLGGIGDDSLSGEAGFDILIGGRDGDTYVFDTLTSGSDLIIDNGNAPVLNGYYSSGLDVVQLGGFASTEAAIHGLDVARSGDDLIVTYQNGANAGTITVKGHFAGPATALEGVEIVGGTTFHVAQLSGDDYTYSVHSGPDQGGEDLVLGTEAGEQIYGGIGSDILAGFGGADNFMFHDEEEANGAHDIILDFLPGQDVLDFTDIKDMTLDDVSIADNAWGNAVVTSVYGSIELDGVTTAMMSDTDFVFA